MRNVDHKFPCVDVGFICVGLTNLNPIDCSFGNDKPIKSCQSVKEVLKGKIYCFKMLLSDRLTMSRLQACSFLLCCRKNQENTN